MERYWTWNYEMRDLGCFPGSDRAEYRGHNTPVEIVTYADAQATIAALQQQLHDYNEKWDAHDHYPKGYVTAQIELREHIQQQLAAAQGISDELNMKLNAEKIRADEWIDHSKDLRAKLATVTAERDAAKHDAEVYQKMHAAGLMDRALITDDLTTLRNLVGALCPGEGCTFTVSTERDEDDLYSVYVDINGHGYGSCAEFYSRQEALAYAAIRTHRATLDAGKEGQGE